MSAGKDVYLSAKEIEIIRIALNAECEHCGDIISDYRQNKDLGISPTEYETKDYDEALERRDIIQRKLLQKIKLGG